VVEAYCLLSEFQSNPSFREEWQAGTNSALENVIAEIPADS